MTITIDTDNPRSVKAIEIAADAGQWAKIHTADGRKMYGVPSSSDPLHFYLVTCSSCTCQDFARSGRDCKHVLAVRLHVGLAKAARALPPMTDAPARKVFGRR